MIRFATSLLVTLVAYGSSFADAEIKANQLAEFQWKMNCQGCHQADASGSRGGAPDMRGIVARFLTVEGGRPYLGRVPGVAYAPLNDQDLAILLNWLLEKYGEGHLPSDFSPYTAKEIGALRRQPLVENAAVMRAELVVALKEMDRSRK